MKRWFYNFILSPHFSRSESIGLSVAVGSLMVSPNFNGALVALYTLLGTAAIVAIAKAMEHFK